MLKKLIYRIPTFLLVLLCLQALDAWSNDQGLQGLANKYSIEIVTQNIQFPVLLKTGVINGSVAATHELNFYIPILSSEFSRYPVECVEKVGLKRLILCKDLSFAKQLRTALPDFEHNDLYLDARRGNYNQDYMRKVLHHEFFHMIDFKDDGLLYEDNTWADLNSADFQYGLGGKNAQNDASMSTIDSSLAGFLNKYSQTGVEEDKAELFANMMVNYHLVAEKAKRDPVLKAKVVYIKELLHNFSLTFDDLFWLNITTSQVVSR